MNSRPSIEAIIFDMDGTLTVPRLDFAAIRAEMGLADGPWVLEAMAAMSSAQRARAEAVLARHEAEAAADARLNDGAAELLGELARRAVPVALLTRNSRVSVEAFCRTFDVRFAATLTRDDGAIKPSPVPVLALCQKMNASPARTLMVGDYLFDILSGRSAGCPTCLIHHGRLPPFADQADIVIERLGELLGRIELAGRPADGPVR